MLTQTQRLLFFSSLLVSTNAGKCPFGFGSSDDDAKPEEKAHPQVDDYVNSLDEKKEVRKLSDELKPFDLGEVIKYPSQLFTCTETDKKKKVLKTAANFTKQEYMDVAE